MSPRCPIVAVLLLALSNSAFSGTWYVKRDAGPGGDGQSWVTAFQRVQDALPLAQPGDEVWVARATYRPGAYSSPRTVSFQMPPGVKIYGGFAGGETLLSQRDWVANETILSGDLHLDDAPGFANRSDNCYHVILLAGAGPTAALDGFTIRGGNADGSGNAAVGGGLYIAGASFGGPGFAHLRFVDNRAGYGGAVGTSGAVGFADSLFEGNHADAGGGVYTEAPITLVRCVLRSNDATTNGGGAFFNLSGSATLTNCLVVANTAFSVGGLYGLYAETYLRNCTLTANHANNIGGAAVDGLALLHVYNSIAWGNTDNTHPGLYDQNLDSNSAVTVFTAVQGGSPPWDRDPLWDEDLRLSCLSPYIDAGSNGHVPAGTTLDLALAARFQDDPATPDTGAGTAPIVDLGAYEFACGCVEVHSYCSALPNGSGTPAAIGWSGSTSLFANALTLAASGAPPLKNGLFFYGSAQVNLPWGDGLRCVGGALQRLALLQTDASGAASFPLDFTQPPLSSGPHALLPGSVWNFQFYFRDPLGGPAGWNSSDALEVGFCP